MPINTFNRSILLTILSLFAILSALPSPPVHAEGKATMEVLQTDWSYLYGGDAPIEAQYYAYGNGIYVSTSQYTSKDGVHWTNKTTAENERDLSKIVFGKGQFIGFNDESSEKGTSVWTSADGVSWSETPSYLPMGNVVDVVFTGKRFVVVASGKSYTKQFKSVVATSDDGVTWTAHPGQLETDINELAWNGKVMLARTAKSLFYSTDGLAWKKVSIPVKGTYGDLAYMNGSFYLAADGAILVSQDGIKWSVTSTANKNWTQIRCLPKRCFVLGKTKQDNPVYMTSSNGKTWSTSKVPSDDFYIDGIVYEKSKYALNRYDVIYESADGINWVTKPKKSFPPVFLTGAAAANGKLVSVGGTTPTSQANNEPLNWRGSMVVNANDNHQYSSVKGKFPLYDVIWTGKSFFAVGQSGLMMTSIDGLKWTKLASPTQQTLIQAVMAGDSYYVVGDGGIILSSKDLKTWRKHVVNPHLAFRGIAWNGKTLLAVGENGMAVRSDDGRNWTKTIPWAGNKNNYYDYSGVAWGNGSFVVITDMMYANSDDVQLFRSEDAKNWSYHVRYNSGIEARGSHTGLHDIQYTGGMFVAVGWDGVILVSRDGIIWSRLSTAFGYNILTAEYYNGQLYVFTAVSAVLRTKLDPATLKSL
ncbi:hypothetical protein [Paenibacillus sp. CF384]|uniref:hypothetical protein n=1 Tax=Paenibacillus sp. CF384 TaxID=1884382 RepID=UPI00089C96EA|nr:hypothetical protein [Paenibacillus sp. CF384]SDX71114.1 hypothetical protein SAMN05518855_101964 [Paenibacillus sp. CF384]